MNDLIDLAKTVAGYAPVLGSILPLPGAKLIGDAIGSLFGGDINNPAELKNKIEADPNAKLKLAELQMQHQQTILDLQNQKLQIETNKQQNILLDKQNARARELNLANNKMVDNTPRVLAYAVTFGLLAMVFVLMFLTDIPQAVQNILSILIGALSTKLSTIIDYYFGSSTDTPPETLGNDKAIVSNNLTSAVVLPEPFTYDQSKTTKTTG